MSSKVYIPKGIDTRKMVRAIENALTGTAKAVKADFQTTTATWNNRPEFTIQTRPAERIVGTDSDVYHYLDAGTKAHDITPKQPGGVLAFKPLGFRPKTRQDYIGSNKGAPGSGPTVIRRKVRHPGFPARNFAERIAEKWQREMPVQVQRAIDAEV